MAVHLNELLLGQVRPPDPLHLIRGALHLQWPPGTTREVKMSTEGRQRPQRVCSIHRGSATSTQGQQRPGASVAVLERMWPSWSVGDIGGRPGALVGVLGQRWAS